MRPMSANRYHCRPGAMAVQRLSQETRQLQSQTVPSQQQNNQKLLQRQAQDRCRDNPAAERLRQQPPPHLLPCLLKLQKPLLHSKVVAPLLSRLWQWSQMTMPQKVQQPCS